MNCNCLVNTFTIGAKMFQSLIGILVNCNADFGEVPHKAEDVSIPNRDFGELQLLK